MENVLNKIDKIAMKEVRIKGYAQSLLRKGKGDSEGWEEKGIFSALNIAENQKALKKKLIVWSQGGKTE